MRGDHTKKKRGDYTSSIYQFIKNIKINELSEHQISARSACGSGVPHSRGWFLDCATFPASEARVFQLLFLLENP